MPAVFILLKVAKNAREDGRSEAGRDVTYDVAVASRMRCDVWIIHK